MKLKVAIFSKRNWQTFKSAKHSYGKKINRQNKQKDKHDVARRRIWFFEPPFHAGTMRFFLSDRKKGNFMKKKNLGIKQESGNQMQNKSRAILIKVNLSCQQSNKTFSK